MYLGHFTYINYQMLSPKKINNYQKEMLTSNYQNTYISHRIPNCMRTLDHNKNFKENHDKIFIQKLASKKTSDENYFKDLA